MTALLLVLAFIILAMPEIPEDPPGDDDGRS